MVSNETSFQVFNAELLHLSHSATFALFQLPAALLLCDFAFRQGCGGSIRKMKMSERAPMLMFVSEGVLLPFQ